MPDEQVFPPPPPAEPVQEGARWRWHRPSSEQVATWFGTQHLDENMEHDHYIGGVVLIPQNEKVKYTMPDGGTTERFEQVFTPYVQIGTRVGYFHALAEKRGLIPVLEPVEVPRSKNPGSAYFNAHMDAGLWWHVVQGDENKALRYLCATWRVALYDPPSYAAMRRGDKPLPVREGRGTKQVTGGADPNAIAKAQTGAVGRALGVAGILVIGTGIATAEDMQELPGYGATPPGPEQAQLPTVPSEIAPGAQPEPEGVDPTEQLEALRSKAMALQTKMQEDTPEAWREFVAWWQERKTEEGWQELGNVPFEGLKAVVSKMEQLHAAPAQATA